MLKSYIDELKGEIVKRADETSLKNEAPRIRLRTGKSLTLQIEELMRTLPPAVRDRPWQICDFVNRLEGKYRERPHPADVGKALRSLGWKRYRDWSVKGAGQRLWSQ